MSVFFYYNHFLKLNKLNFNLTFMKRTEKTEQENDDDFYYPVFVDVEQILNKMKNFNF